MAPQNKIFFFPFDPGHPGFFFAQHEFGSGTGALNHAQLAVDHEVAKGGMAVARWWKPGTADPFVQSMNTGQIYIRGHGEPGIDFILGGRGGEHVSYQQVADRLEEAGLQKIYDGKIKLFNCHSAEAGSRVMPDGQSNMMPGFRGIPFAQLVADELFSRGYRSCSFFGYVGPIDSKPKIEPGRPGEHYYRREIRTDAQGVSSQQVISRASEARVQFRPTSSHRKSTTTFGRMLGFGR